MVKRRKRGFQPTLTQQNKTLKKELVALNKEKKKLNTELEVEINQALSPEGGTEAFESKLLRKLAGQQCQEVITKVDDMMTHVLEMHRHIIEDLKRKVLAERMKYHELEQIQTQSQRMEPTCLVCLNETGPVYSHNAVSLPCGHTYGRGCIVKWIKEQQQCPQCRNLTLPTQYRAICIKQII